MYQWMGVGSRIGSSEGLPQEIDTPEGTGRNMIPAAKTVMGARVLANVLLTEESRAVGVYWLHAAFSEI
jgi:hypothetical protein